MRLMIIMAAGLLWFIASEAKANMAPFDPNDPRFQRRSEHKKAADPSQAQKDPQPAQEEKPKGDGAPAAPKEEQK